MSRCISRISGLYVVFQCLCLVDFRSDAVIAISPGLFRHLRLDQHPHGICLPDAVCSAADSVLETPKEKFVAFVSGTLSAVKRPEEALRIFHDSETKQALLNLLDYIISRLY